MTTETETTEGETMPIRLDYIGDGVAIPYEEGALERASTDVPATVRETASFLYSYALEILMTAAYDIVGTETLVHEMITPLKDAAYAYVRTRPAMLSRGEPFRPPDSPPEATRLHDLLTKRMQIEGDGHIIVDTVESEKEVKYTVRLSPNSVILDIEVLHEAVLDETKFQALRAKLQGALASVATENQAEGAGDGN